MYIIIFLFKIIWNSKSKNIFFKLIKFSMIELSSVNYNIEYYCVFIKILNIFVNKMFYLYNFFKNYNNYCLNKQAIV